MPRKYLVIVSTILFFGASSLTVTAQEPAPKRTTETTENSTKKFRVRPSKIAERIGTAVLWRSSVAKALTEAQQTGKPVFWYINTVPATFTDRKVEIDRYMLAGPFSYPKIIELLNNDFIPVREAPDDQLSEKYDLRTYAFVEPGFLVISPTGQVTGRVDRLTTLPPAWLLELFKKYRGKDKDAERNARETVPSIWSLPEDSPARMAFEKFMTHPHRGTVELSSFDTPIEDRGQKLEAQLMKGMMQYYSGNHAEARSTWRSAMEIDVDHPLAWKAAAEREGFGPFVRGFEVFSPLPVAAQLAGIESLGSAAPAQTYSEVELWRRSVQFLLAMQRDDGALIDSDYDFGGTDSLPNVYVAVTSLVGLSLMEARGRVPEESAAIDAALEQAAEYVRDEKNINPVDRDEILWAYAYRLRFLVARLRMGSETLETVNQAVSKLESVQGNRGSWYHEYSNSFVTATALVALADAKQAGASINQDIVDKGLLSLQRDRYANGAYPYSSARGNRSNATEDGDIPASAGRMPICEVALLLWGKSDQTRLQFAVEKSLEHHDKLSVAYKYDNHTSTLAYGGFFFWYDMQSRADAIRHLANPEFRMEAARQHQQLIFALPEIDGCFVDSHELGRCYGTAMALLSMSVLNTVLEPAATR
ncbi:MAG: terpene cyclase/mutase family protein [Planctomycetaceae bacterium]|nr:terpene cyclase/mutase family protein [Planctomycetaceae bacterium]